MVRAPSSLAYKEVGGRARGRSLGLSAAGGLARDPPHVQGFEGVELRLGQVLWVAASGGKPLPQTEEGASVLGNVADGDVEVLVAVPVGAGGAQAADEGVFGGAAGPAQQHGQRVAEGQEAQKVLLVGVEGVEGSDLLFQPPGEGGVLTVGP